MPAITILQSKCHCIPPELNSWPTLQLPAGSRGRSALRDPFAGIGKPEPLRENRAACWSRRIDQEHRLVDRLEGRVLVIRVCRYQDR